ncbi:hypothetical protein JHK82_035504 [Glycine max]|nr:hypothetical protein JHK82_035504 [Glycine max]
MALHLSTALSFVCREEEKNMVLEFCKGCIEHQKAGNLYIYSFLAYFIELLVRELGFQFEVYRNDELTVELKRTSRFWHIFANSFGAWTNYAIVWCVHGIWSSYHFQSFLAGRYHGLVIDKDSFPDDELEVTASTKDGLIMTARHKKYKHLR